LPRLHQLCNTILSCPPHSTSPQDPRQRKEV
jgi:hypothetical protein